MRRKDEKDLIEIAKIALKAINSRPGFSVDGMRSYDIAAQIENVLYRIDPAHVPYIKRD